MKNNAKKQKNHWFNLADGIIITVSIGLILWAVLAYLAPTDKDVEAETVEASLGIIFPEDETLTYVAKGDPVFCGETKVGVIKEVETGLGNSVSLSITLEKTETGVALDGKPLYENGDFTLETKLRRIEGTVFQILLKEDE